MSYKHGVYVREVPTSIVPPVAVNSAIPAYVVTAPIHLSENPYGVTNEPKLLYTYKEAVSLFGYSTSDELWDEYTSNEVINSHFVLYGVAPIMVINVLDPTRHIERFIEHKVAVVDGVAIINVHGVLKDTVIVDDENAVVTGFNEDGYLVVASEMDEINVSFNRLDPTLVTMADIVGGYDIETGKNKGLELISELYSMFRLIPTQIVVPKYSESPTVAMIMDSKASNINGCFNAVSIVDIPTKVENQLLKYTDVPQYKNDNNIISNRQIACYPKVALDGRLYDYSTHVACLIMKTDNENGGIPYASFSNNVIKVNRVMIDKDTSINLNNEQANFLNGNGITTVTNFVKGFCAWGNRTTIYPSSTDVKDTMIPVRRMMDFVGNTIVSTYWSKLDLPMNKRNIDTIIDSINIWLNSLTSSGYLLGGSIELAEENDLIGMMDGIIRFKVKLTPPSPMREIDFILEYDPNNMVAFMSLVA